MLSILLNKVANHNVLCFFSVTTNHPFVLQNHASITMQYICKRSPSAHFTAHESSTSFRYVRKNSLVLSQTLIDIYFTMIKTERFYNFPTTEVIFKVVSLP